jgi:hypothetical protein
MENMRLINQCGFGVSMRSVDWACDTTYPLSFSSSMAFVGFGFHKNITRKDSPSSSVQCIGERLFNAGNQFLVEHVVVGNSIPEVLGSDVQHDIEKELAYDV